MYIVGVDPQIDPPGSKSAKVHQGTCPRGAKEKSAMVYDVIEKEIKSLPEDKLPEVLNFIAFVKYQASIEALSTEKTIKRRTNTLTGGTFFMAEDFDETPECFKEYTV